MAVYGKLVIGLSPKRIFLSVLIRDTLGSSTLMMAHCGTTTWCSLLTFGGLKKMSLINGYAVNPNLAPLAFHLHDAHSVIICETIRYHTFQFSHRSYQLA